MYLEQRAAEDALFAKNYRNPAKNIDDCVTYILNYVQKSGCNGFTDGNVPALRNPPAAFNIAVYIEFMFHDYTK